MAHIGTYKGHVILNLSDRQSFGLVKAREILANLEAIKAFVSSEGKSCSTAGASDPALGMIEENERLTYER